MRFVMVKAGSGLAFVVPDHAGGTDLVYLTGKPDDRPNVSLQDLPECVKLSVGATNADAALAAEPSGIDRLIERLSNVVLKSHE
jgi:hypothetical protein